MFERTLASILWHFLHAPSFFRMSAIEVAFKLISNLPLSWECWRNFVMSSFTTLQHLWNKSFENPSGPRALSPFIPFKASSVLSSSNGLSSCSAAFASIEVNCRDYISSILLSTWKLRHKLDIRPMHDVVGSHIKPTSQFNRINQCYLTNHWALQNLLSWINGTMGLCLVTTDSIQ